MTLHEVASKQDSFIACYSSPTPSHFATHAEELDASMRGWKCEMQSCNKMTSCANASNADLLNDIADFLTKHKSVAEILPSRPDELDSTSKSAPSQEKSHLSPISAGRDNPTSAGTSVSGASMNQIEDAAIMDQMQHFIDSYTNETAIAKAIVETPDTSIEPSSKLNREALVQQFKQERHQLTLLIGDSNESAPVDDMDVVNYAANCVDAESKIEQDFVVHHLEAMSQFLDKYNPHGASTSL